ncbi:MAG: helix-turn-helix domain-containing protein [Syntrophales bacterium]|nr:helix-turn-helix domain-containing protein [Syntrophales bacterium]
MKINEIFRIARETRGKKQQEIASKAGIRQSSLQRFETGLAKLSKVTLVKIAPSLDINPEYVVDQTKNPFNSKGLIKMFFSEKFLDPTFQPIVTLMFANSKLEFISLVVSPRLVAGIKNIMPFQSPVYAVAIRDQDNNIFLLRKKSETDFVIADGDLLCRQISFTFPFIKEKGRSLYFSNMEIDTNLYKKIKTWTVEREDIEPFFSQCEFMSYLDPTQQELAQLRKQRDMNIEPLTVLELTIMKEIRVEEIGSDQALKLIQSGKTNIYENKRAF